MVTNVRDMKSVCQMGAAEQKEGGGERKSKKSLASGIESDERYIVKKANTKTVTE